MLYFVHDGTAMSVGAPAVRHLGSKPISTAGAFVALPLSTKDDPVAGRKSGLLPVGPANNVLEFDTRLLDGIVSVPPLKIQPAAGSCVDPVGTATLLTIVSPSVLLPDVK